jgi:hypothetical protein
MRDLRREGDFTGLDTAPMNGQLVIGREASGEEFLMRWRSRDRVLKEDGPDDQAPGYWARWHSDSEVVPVEWAHTSLKMDDVLDWA